MLRSASLPIAAAKPFSLLMFAVEHLLDSVFHGTALCALCRNTNMHALHEQHVLLWRVNFKELQLPIKCMYLYNIYIIRIFLYTSFLIHTHTHTILIDRFIRPSYMGAHYTD